MNIEELEVGDIVIGNREANNCYAKTREGWIGRVTRINMDSFSAMSITNLREFERLNPKCFNFYFKKPKDTATDLAKKLNLYKENHYDYN